MQIGIITDENLDYHQKAFSMLKSNLIKVENKVTLDKVEGLVLCGDDALKLRAMINKLGLSKIIFNKAKKYFPIMAISSAVAILAQDKINKEDSLNLLDLSIQISEGFKEIIPLNIPVLGQEAFKGFFKKNIFLSRIAPNIGILCQTKEQGVVFIRQGNILALTFHPEYSDDYRIHKLFLKIIKNNS